MSFWRGVIPGRLLRRLADAGCRREGSRYPFPMPNGRGPDDAEDGPPRLSLWQRVLLALPSLRRDGDKAPAHRAPAQRRGEAGRAQRRRQGQGGGRADDDRGARGGRGPPTTRNGSSGCCWRRWPPPSASSSATSRSPGPGGPPEATARSTQHHNLSTYDELELILLVWPS
jgi:hypothetical protein